MSMKVINVFIGLVLLFSVQSCIEERAGTIATAEADYDTYLDMRDAILEINPKDFGFDNSKESIEVFGVVVDVNNDNTISTISSMKTGDVSVYKSTGKLYLGGIQVPKFKKMALELVDEAQKMVSSASEFENKVYPNSGYAKFYFITNSSL